MSIRGPKLKYFVIILAVIALVAGIYDLFFRSQGFVKTTATVVGVEEVEPEGADDDTEYAVTVQYEADGVQYTGRLDQTRAKRPEEGSTIEVVYDPQNPSVVRDASKGFGIYMLVVGLALLIFEAVTMLREKKTMEQLQDARPGGEVRVTYAPSERGEERELYFLSDMGTAKIGHRIEDRDRRILYEAKVTKFTLAAPTGFDFVDHEHGRTVPHLIGHEEETEWNTILLDNHYTFTIDGEYIWDHLKRNGVTVESSFQEGKILRPQYRIFRDGQEMARVESSSMHVHEEDAEKAGKLGDLVPVPGFYRIWTREQNLDLLFVTILAFARTGAHDEHGGNYGLLFGKKHTGENDAQE